ncbi:uncharacterized protein si:dkeyp-38g8.5 isoform X2 [Dunckerocampus dactyliophorus]|uniref:uncharacterized protein si:dkeyp-38g8.5 isoform X2 n=1 Tax=Dunckerocampus dactyliophorus TaxID=161453 RepID=UPI002404B484|nr:uncharacterized protein si:dkeyp-38g8.5 isoform X2 [Dunckerocampus dactyliophorus]
MAGSEATEEEVNLKETEDFVKLRVSNNYLFSGKKNTALYAWRHMGLQDKITHRQASKKWENLRKKYKALKDQDHRDKWPHFNLMNDAMEGRLEGSAPILGISPEDKGYFSPLSKVKKIRTSTKTASPVKVQNGDAEIEVTLNGDGAKEEDDGMEGSTDFNSIHQDEDVEGRTTELEHLALQRERALLDREIAILERDRVLLEREKLLIERETAALKREREMVARDKERLASERRKAAPMGKPEADDGSKDRRERFLQLFEKLIDSM